MSNFTKLIPGTKNSSAKKVQDVNRIYSVLKSRKQFRLAFASLLFVLLCGMSNSAFAQGPFYNMASTDPSVSTNWTTDQAGAAAGNIGSGSNPANFDLAATYILENAPTTTAGSWTLGGGAVATVLEISYTGATVTMGAALTVSSGATLQVDASVVLNMGTSILTLTGATITNNGTVQTAAAAGAFIGAGNWGSTGTVVYNKGAAQAVIAGTYNNLTVGNGAFTYTAGGNIDVNGTLTVNASSTFAMGANILGGTPTSITNSGTITTACPTGTSATPIPANYNWGGTVSYNAANTVAQTLVLGTFNNLTISVAHTTGAITLSSGTIYVGGNFTASGATTVINTGNTIEFTASAGGKTVGGMTYNNLTLDNTSGTNTVAGANITVQGGLTTTAGGTFAMSTFVLGGSPTSITNNGTITTACVTGTSATPLPVNYNWGGTVNYNAAAAGAQTLVLGTFNNLTINTAHTSGAITLPSGTIYVGGNFTATGATTVNNTGSTFEFTSATGGQNIGGLKYMNLIMDNSTSGTNTATGAAITVQGTLTVPANGTFNMAALALTLTGATINNNGTIQTQANAGAFVGAADWGNSGTVQYNRANTQTIIGGTYNNLIVGNGAFTHTAGGNIDVNGTLTVNASSTFAMSTFILGGTPTSIVNNSTISTACLSGTSATPLPSGLSWGGTVSYVSGVATAQTIVTGTYNNLSLSSHTTGPLTLASGLIAVGGNFVVTAGTTVFTTTGNTFEYTAAAGAQTVGGITYNNLTLDNTSGTNTAGAAITVGGTLTTGTGIFSMAANVLTLTGATIVNNGTILTTAAAGAFVNASDWGSTGTVQYNAGSAQSVITGSYNNLTVGNGAFAYTASGKITVIGTLNVASATSTLAMSGNVLDGTPTLISNSGTISTNCTSVNPLPAGMTWGGTVTYSVTAGGQSVVSGTYNKLTLLNSSSSDIASGDIMVNSTLTTTAGGTFDMGANALSGTITSAGTGTIATQNTTPSPIPSNIAWAGTVSYNATGGGQSIVPGTYTNLSSGAATGSGTNTATGTMTVNTTVATTASYILDMSTNVMSGAFTAAGNSGTFQTEVTGGNPFVTGKTWGGTVNYNATSAGQNIMGGTYHNLTIGSTGGTNTAGAAITVNTALTVNSNVTLDMVASALTLTGATIANSGTIKTQATAGAFVGVTNWGASGTVFYNAGAGQAVIAGTYNNLTVGNNSTFTYTPTGSTYVNGALTVNTSATLAMGNNVLAGTPTSITNNGTVTTTCPTATSATPIPVGQNWTGAGTVTFGGGATIAQTLVTGTFNNLTVSAAHTTGAITLPSGTIKVGGNFTALGGVVTNNTGNTFEFTSLTGSQNVGGFSYNNLTLDNTSGTNTATGANITVIGTITTTAGGNFNMAALLLTLTGATITNNGTISTIAAATAFTSGLNWGNAGTVVYNDGAAQSVIAGTYNNLTVGNGAFAYTASGNITVNGTLNVASATSTFAMSTSVLSGTPTISNSGTISTACLTATSSTPLPAGLVWNGQVTYAATTSPQTMVGGTYNNLTSGITTSTLTATGDITVNGALTTTTGAAGAFDLGANFLLEGTSFTVTNNGTIKTSAIQITTTNPAIPANKSWTGTTGLVIYAAAGQTVVPGTYKGLTAANASGTITAGGDLVVNGTLTNTAGGIMDMSTYALSGTLTPAGTGTLQTENTSSTPFTTGKTWTGTVNYNVAGGGQTVMAGTYNNLTLSNTTGTNTPSGSFAVNVGNMVTSAGGILDMGTTSLLGGTGIFTGVAGTIKTSVPTATSAVPIPTAKSWGGTIEYAAATGLQTIVAGSYVNLTMDNTGATTNSAGGATTVTGTLTTTSDGTYNMAANLLTLTGATIANNGTISTTAAATAFTSGVNWGIAGTVSYLDGAAQSVIAGTYNNLTIGNGAFAYTASGNINVGGALTVNSGSTFAMGANILGGTPSSIANSGTVTTACPTGTSATPLPAGYNWGGTVNYNSALTIAQTLVLGTFNNLTINVAHTTGTITLPSGTIYVGGNFTSLGATTVINTGSVVEFTSLTGGQNVGGMTYRDLKMDNTSGTNTATGAAITVQGTLTVPSGGTFNMAALVLTLTGATISNSGTVQTQATAGAFVNASDWGSTGTVQYNAGVAQSVITGSYNSLTIGSAAVAYTASNNVKVIGTLNVAAASTFAMSTFVLSGTFTPSVSGTLSTACVTGTSVLPVPSMNWGSTGTVNFVSAGATAQTIPVGTYNNLSITGTTGTRAFAGATNVGSNFSINTTSGATTLGGTLTIGGNTTLTGTTSNNILVCGANQINAAGDWTVFSTTATGLLNGGTGTVVLNGNGSQTISSTGGSVAPNFFNLTVANTSFPIAVNSSTNVTGTMSVSANTTVNPAVAAQFNSGGAAGTITGNGMVEVTRTVVATADFSNQYKFSTPTVSALTVDYTANSAQTVNALAYGTLKTSTGGTKTAAGNVTVNNGLDVGSGTTLDMGAASRLIAGTSPTYTVNGILKTSVPTATSSSPLPTGANYGGSGTVEYVVLSGAQSAISGTYNNLQFDNTSGTNTVTGGDITVNNVLTLGNVTLGSNNLILGASASVSGVSSSKYVVTTGSGRLRMMLNANGTYTYPVGDATNYSPISLTVSGSGYSSAYAEAKVVAGSQHPNDASSTNYLTRYWTVGTSGITSQSYDATATYVAGDIQGTDASIVAGQYTGSLPWIKFGAANTGAKTITATGISIANSDFTGISSAVPTVFVTPSSVSICSGGTATVTATGGGDPTLTYVWTPSAGLSATTGAGPIIVSSTVTTTYTVTVTDGNGFTASTTLVVSVGALPVVTGNLIICSSGGNTTTLASTTPGGTWSSGSTGVATVGSLSGIVTGVSPGTSVIVYSVTGCSSGVSSTVTVNPYVPGLCECTPSGNMDCSTGEYISLVSLTGTGLSNSSSCDGGWTVYPTSTATGKLVIGNSYSLNVRSGSSFSGDAIEAFVDFDQNGSLGDAGEYLLVNGSVSAANTIYSNTLAVPGSATAGNTTLRVRYIGDGSAFGSGTSCTASGVHGEVEDYTVCLYAATTVNTTPASNTTACVGGTPTLSVTATGSGLTYQWYSSSTTSEVSGTSLIAGATNATYSPSTASQGTYFYFCVITNVCGVTTNSPSNVASIVTVNPAPSSSGATNDGPICNSGSVTLTDNSSNTTAWSWTGSDGFTSTAQSPVATPTATTTYSLTLTNGVGSGCSPATVYATTVTVNATPSSSGVTNNGPICNGVTVTLSANSTNASAWTWTGSDGSASTAQNPVMSPTATTTYSLTISNGAGSGCNPATVYTTTVTVSPTPLSSGATNDGPICVGGTVNLSANSSNATAWSWTGSNGFTSTVQNPVTSPTATATYSLTVSSGAASGCSPATVYTTSVTVNPVPTSSGVTNDGPITSGNSATLTANSSNATAWSWVGSDGFTSTVQNPVVSPTVSVIYSLTVSSPGNGCDPATIYTTILNVDGAPAPVTAGGGGTYCGSTTITAGNGGDGTIYFQGMTSNGTSTVTPSVAEVVTVTGTYYFRAQSGAGVWGAQGSVSVTINPIPADISGITNVCVASTTNLTDADAGGAWSISNPLIATIGTGSGTVTGVSAGITTVTYTLPLTGCYNTTTVLSSPIAAPITGTTSACTGTTMSLSDITNGGTWSTSDAAVATVSLYAGVVTALTQGTATITYSLSTGCIQTTTVSVNASSASISGTNTVCTGLTTTLTNATGTGTWSSGSTGIATIGSSSGIVTGVTAGNATISYVLPSGCTSTRVVTVNPLPATVTVNISGSYCVNTTITASNGGDGTIYYQGTTSGGTSIATPATSQIIASSGTYYFRALSNSGCWGTEGSATITINPLPSSISGASTVCAGSSAVLSDVTAGGTWSSGNGSVATVGTDGTVTGVAGGTVNITYTAATGCSVTKNITVFPIPSISGANVVCTGLTTTLTDAVTGGTWTSSDGAIATIGSSSGTVSGVAQGTVGITYTLNTGCSTAKVVTVNPTPTSILGTGTVCVGLTTTLSDATGSGTWSSSGSVAGIGSSSGIVSGTTSGTATITYLLSTGCKSTTVVTVNPLPSAIAGTASVCVGLTTSLSDATAGGTWSSSDGALATVGTSGIVTGVSAGTPMITYTLTTGCIRTTTVTVNPLTAITGSTPVCVASTLNLDETTPGGTWASSSTSVATVGSTSGIVTGAASGTATITYLLSTGCKSTTVVTVNPLPSTISGTASVCVGLTTSLSDATAGGTWASSDGALATVGTSGTVTGIAAGNPVITYTLSTGCLRTTTITVNPLASVTGSAPVCVGFTISLTDAASGGTWASSSTSVATVATTGVVTGVAAGTSTITYSLSAGGCKATTVVTVNSLPGNITGTGNVCVGSTSQLTDATAGGTWSSSDDALATVGTSGIVTGVSPGVPTISYTLSTGCYRATPATVNPVPSAITGTTAICAGSTTSLSNVAPGGTWSSSTTSVATVGTTGIVTAVAGGTTTITYTMAAGCTATATVTVTAILPITGVLSACVGSTTTLNDATGSGTWSSSNTSVGTVGSTSGIVTGILNGTTTISYTVASTGCTRTVTVAVNSTPTSILGASTVCVGGTTTLSDAVTGGTWSSNNGNATINGSTGVVTGSNAGTSNITYTSGSGCTATTTMTVQANPSPIQGATSECQGVTIALSDATASGTWSTSNGNASVDGSGNVTGISVGTSTISYTSATTGCFVTYANTIFANPTAILGANTVCANSTIQLSDATSGALSWTSSNGAVATAINSGTITGVAAGTAIITYKILTGSCIATTVITVNAQPAAVSGNTSVCAGSTLTLTDAAGSGAWTSSNAAVATIGSSSGVVTGVAGGTSTIDYIPTGGACGINAIVTVNPILAINGTKFVCSGSTTSLSDATAGGTWSSSNASVGTVGTSGIVTGIGSGGTVTISYTITSTGCVATATVTVNTLPGGILGASTMCTNGTTQLSNATAGGVWTTSNGLIANVGTSGLVTASFTAGTANITYSLGGCTAVQTITVNLTPTPVQGVTAECVGVTTLLTDNTAGGTWSSSNGNATIDGSGNITGVTAGTSTTTYTMPSGCYITYPNTVQPVPTAILGTYTVCAGSTTQLSDATPNAISWTSSNAAVATAINSGAVTGVAAGTAIITYKILTGFCYATQVVTVDPIPAAITGNSAICLGNGINLTDVTASGTWSSTNTAAATVGTSGTVTSVAAGTSIIDYTLATGCANSVIVTVNPIAAITGNTPICMGQSIALSDAVDGGTWSSDNTGVASVNPTDGTVSSIGTGTATISYLMSTGCNASVVVTVTSIVGSVSVTGATTICSGTTTTLTDPTLGGSWSSGDITIGTVDASTGIATGISAGTVNITYSIGAGCVASNVITVIAAPATLQGSNTVCAGLTTALSDVTPDGSWTSSNTAVAEVSVNTGLMTGISGGNADITYTTPNGCYNTLAVTVNPLVSMITGITTLCTGATNNLTDATAGGTWSSSDVSIATVGSTGVVTGVSGGYATITYTLSTGCSNAFSVVVNPYAGVITGANNVDISATTALTDAIGGGTWSSSNGNATVDGTGSVTGVIGGTATISYSVTNVCGTAVATKVLTVNVGPAQVIVSGGGAFCGSTTITADNGGDGITYFQGTTSMGTSTVTPSSSELITTSGTYYFRALSGGLWGAEGSVTVTINPVAAAVSGTGTVCTGFTTSLSDADAGGTWSSSNGNATVGTDGTVTGVTAGTATITYTLATGCAATSVVTINSLPSAISGTAVACEGLTASLSSSTGGGAWSSSATVTGTIDPSSGLFTAIAAGTTTISYTLSTGCYVTTTATVNALPGSINGTAAVCAGLTTTLTDATAGGAWSSSTTSVATISTAGVVTGVAAGTSAITYSLGTGCIMTATVTVNALPSAITGTRSVCIGSTTALTDAGGGTWASSATSIGTVDASGVVTGISTGTTAITYTLATGCITTTTVTVNALPSTVIASGAGTFCGSTTITAANGGSGTIYFQGATSGGTSTATPSTSQIVSSTGTYYFRALSSAGCWGTEGSVTVSINPSPAAITGTQSVCAGLTTALTDATASGDWTSSNGNATVGTDGTVTGVTAGTATISYALPTGCLTTATVTVNALPSGINGTLNICAGTTTSLSSSTAGGTWSSSATGVATIGSISGIATGVSGGTSSITYTILSTGCLTSSALTINALPATVIASGGGTFCGSTTITAANGSDGTIYYQGTTSGGTSTATPSVSQLISTSGTYYFRALSTTGCWGTEGSVTVSINAYPAAITGTQTVCNGLSITLSDATGGGTWSSSDGAVGTVGSTSGVVTALGTGTTTISYTLASGCGVAATVTVNPVPAAISGTAAICLGNTTTLSDVTASGTWTSGNTFVATVGSSSGIVTGLVSGNANITYILATGCLASVNLTVNPLPSAIIGSTSICLGAASSLSDAAAGGNWTSSATGVATIDASGNITTVSSGTSDITYTLPTGCTAATTITINPVPSSINGTGAVCTGLTTALTDADAGGAWTSNTTSVATIVSGTGVVTGVTAGTSTITYAFATGCNATTVVTVNQSPAAIAGTARVCVGLTTSLSNSVAGGAWSSSDAATGSVGTSGIVTGVAAGTATITYAMTSGCQSTVVVTVNPLASITGSSPICVGNTVALTDAASGGAWSSSSTAIATISTAGVVTGVASGTSKVTYLLPTGCQATDVVTVNPLPGNINGSNSVCTGATLSLSDPTASGTWASSDGAVATVGTSGTVTGVTITGGTATISYTLATGCYVTRTITVNPITPIQNISAVCSGSSITLTDATAGGTWSSSYTFIAPIGTGGTITGAASGTSTISYTLATGCRATGVVTVNPLPSAITGNSVACVGFTITLTDAGGGTWSPANPSIATVGTNGIVTGAGAGTTNITYTLPTGCIASVIVTINDVPTSINGTAIMCAGSTTSLSDAVTGGTWSSSNTSAATIASTGIVSGVAGGTSTITYTMAAGCYATTVVTVSTIFPITGTLSACVASTTTLADASIGGTWTSSNPSIGSVGSSTGIVAGIAPGTITISYTIPSGCVRTATVAINDVPTSVLGPSAVCPSATITLTDATTGGTWATSDASKATVGSATGVVTGVAAGTVTITYIAGAGCTVTKAVTVNSSPLPIQGAASECQGITITLSDASASGTWSTSNGNASADGSGNVTGVTVGTSTISYTLANGCFATYSNSILAIPSAILGTAVVCPGATTQLSDATPNAQSWTSSNASVASVINSGTVTGVVAGTATITYKVLSGCYITTVVTVNSTPSAISGNSAICAGSTLTLTDASGAGTWASSSAGIATVGSSTGIVTGISGGNATITYTASTGCTATAIVTINPISAISGSTSACVGATTTLSDASASGTWSSSNTGVATIGSSSGIVTGVASGTTTITYSIPSGCYITTTVTVGPISAITGTASVCTQFTTNLTDATPGGTWTTSNGLIANVGTSGLVTASTSQAGTATISYTVGSCAITKVVTVNLTPTPVQGVTSECVGITNLLTDATAGGAWSSSNSNVTIDGSGNATGAIAGTATISYTMSTGCYITYPNTVYANPSAILGTASVCTGSTTQLSDATSGAISWTSSNASVASVINSGTVTGVAQGTATITYKILTGSCYITRVVTVNPVPGAGTILGTMTVVVGNSVTLTNATSSGVWTSSNTGIATIGSSSGTATGVFHGTISISYTVTNGFGCAGVAVSSFTVTTTAPHSTSSNSVTICLGSSVTLNDVTPGGVWNSSNNNIAVVDGNGVVTGIFPGNATISYTLANGFGTSVTTIPVGVDPLPGAVTISADPGTRIGNGEMLTLSASGDNVGTDPAYQWLINNVPVQGATSSSFTSSSFSDNDSVTCEIISSGTCSGIVVSGTVGISVSSLGISGSMTAADDIRILPNPNKGAFSVTGNAGVTGNVEVSVEVTDVLGQVIYQKKVMTQDGTINEKISLSGTLANGMYMLNLRSDSGNKSFHFVIEK